MSYAVLDDINFFRYYYTRQRDPVLSIKEIRMKLLFAERLRKNRCERKLTQEQLAQAIKISPQSVSKWERGDGYPDITLLPRIANFFEITVDELIGNDEATRMDDIEEFCTRFWRLPDDQSGNTEKLALAMEYHRKYPSDFEVMDLLEYAIVGNMDTISEHLPLLRELHEKIMGGCTIEQIRRDSIHRMCYVCPDEELDDCIGKSELDWAEAISIGEMCEERYRKQQRYPEYCSRRNTTDLLIFMKYIGRNNMQYYEADNPALFAEPERTIAWELHKMRLLEQFDDNGIPEAWCGCYAEASLKAAAAMLGCGKINEGFMQLEHTFDLYEHWLKIPDGQLMDAGCPAAFGGAKITKADSSNTVYIHLADGTEIWSPYLWLFWQIKSDIYTALTKWPWFDGVKHHENYIAACERAKRMAGID